MMAPSTPRWVKLRSMQTPWPACVYEDYSAAARCMHEVGDLRAAKPVLDAEDRVVFFFGVGVGQRAMRARGTGVAPTLQLCVAHKDDVTDAAFKSKLDFGAICREIGLPEDAILRTEMSSVFQRACDEAEKLVGSSTTEEQATQVFVDMVKEDTSSSSGQKTALDEAMEIEEPASGEKSVSKIPKLSHAKSKPASKPDQMQRLPSPPTKSLASELLPAPQQEALTAKCWELMQDAGWEIMEQANGARLYKMPGVSFFDFQPNVNIFDSREKACAQFLKSWSQSTAGVSSQELNQSGLFDAVWPLMVETGWHTMSSANETWFIMPNTPFDKCVPNVTIFSGKEQAVAKYLSESAFDVSSDPATAHTEEDSDVISNDGTEVLETEDISQLSSSQAETVAGSDSSETSDEDEDGDEVDDGVAEEGDDAVNGAIPVVDLTKNLKSKKGGRELSNIRRAVHPKAKRFVALSPETSQLSQPTTPSQSAAVSVPPKSKPTVVIPPFKLKFGDVEDELRRRGWFWRDSPLGFKYFQPHCKDRKDSELSLDKDFFYGKDGLETHLRGTELLEDIHDTLFREHERRHSPDDDDSSVEEASGRSSAKPRTQQKRSKSKSERTGSKKKATIPARSSLPKRSPSEQKRPNRKRQRSSTQTTQWEPKFGDIWRKLQEEGWHFQASSLEYDYFTPNCKSIKDGKMDVDYFRSTLLLQDHLRKSGIWDRVAKELKNEVQSKDDGADSQGDSDNEPEKDAPGANGGDQAYVNGSPMTGFKQQRGRKRKSSLNGSVAESEDIFDFDFDFDSNSVSKKQRNSNEFRTPIAAKRALTPSARIATVNTPVHDDSISPDLAGLKELEHASVPNSAMPRNLANAFTPSPSNVKKPKPSEMPSSEIETSPAKETDPVSAAIRRLTASYTPGRFRHRESEFAEIRGFFRQCFMQRRGASLYISGAPGCGKTALLKSTERDIEELHGECFANKNARLVRLHVNAMSLKDTGALVCELAEAVTKRGFNDPEAAFDAIEAATSTTSSSKRHTTLVLVLDEMDTLLSRAGVESDLCRLFELAHRPAHAFALVGIANQVDFTERHLPLLKARLPDCRPRVLVFKAYAHETIEQILVERLGGKQQAAAMLNAHGISFLARKVASTTGDIRLALDTCRRILQHKAQQDKENPATAGPGRPMALSDMLRLIKHSLESKSALAVQSLPRNLQMILLASTRLSGAHPGALLAVDELYASYRDVCDAAGVLAPLSARAFRGSLDILSAEGLVAPAELKRQLVKPSLSASELLQSFRGDAYLSRLI